MKVRHYVSAMEISALPEEQFVHSLDAGAIRHERCLSEQTGMTRLGIHLVRVEPGHATTVYHCHHTEEEFVYVLSGSGTAEIDGVVVSIGPGDFMGFPIDGAGHVMRNNGTEDLVYLMGGERHRVEVSDYPWIRKRMVRVDGRRQVVDLPD